MNNPSSTLNEFKPNYRWNFILITPALTSILACVYSLVFFYKIVEEEGSLQEQGIGTIGG
jgi:hypothetical protein